MKNIYLERIKIVTFGVFNKKDIGPFSPGLNVIFGKNEAGKTTLATFIGGVLFGWHKARGSQNTYKPENAERSGSLFFSSPRGEIELSRTRNKDGLIGDKSLLEDIDKATFDTMFSLTSDELLSLKNTNEVTSKLLTAGSGTGSSPTWVLEQIQGQLARYTSRAAGAESSLTNLKKEQEKLFLKMTQASSENDRYRLQDKEFYDLKGIREEVQENLSKTNEEIEWLKSARDQALSLTEDLAALVSEQGLVHEELYLFNKAHGSGSSEGQKKQKILSLAEERLLRERIDAYVVEEAKCDSAVDLTKAGLVTSTSLYEALLDEDGDGDARKNKNGSAFKRTFFSAVLPTALGALGFFLFWIGILVNTFSFKAVGLALVFAAVLWILFSLVSLLFPSPRSQGSETSLMNAKRAMIQDGKKLEASRTARETLKTEVKKDLDGAGLEAARGSLKQARCLLDEMCDARVSEEAHQQKVRSLEARQSYLSEAVASKNMLINDLLIQAGLLEGCSVQIFERLISDAMALRAKLQQDAVKINVRYGELMQELSAVAELRDFDRYKLELELINTRIEESLQNYARLLLARRILEDSIVAWESVSQPEVFRQASRLFCLMTDGRWTRVSVSAEGEVLVTDSVKSTSIPEHLSLGTCQQLYLALRIALLMTAQNVGSAIPILADDILVNFDSERRVGAARAIVELASKRQVILFTCHEEIVKTMRRADPTLNEILL